MDENQRLIGVVVTVRILVRSRVTLTFHIFRIFSSGREFDLFEVRTMMPCYLDVSYILRIFCRIASSIYLRFELSMIIM